MITRERYALDLLARADGPKYDELLAAIVAKFPCGKGREDYAKTRAARVIQDAVLDQLAVTEPDGTVWATPKGWGLIMSARRVEAAAAGQRRGT